MGFSSVSILRKNHSWDASSEYCMFYQMVVIYLLWIIYLIPINITFIVSTLYCRMWSLPRCVHNLAIIFFLKMFMDFISIFYILYIFELWQILNFDNFFNLDKFWTLTKFELWQILNFDFEIKLLISILYFIFSIFENFEFWTISKSSISKLGKFGNFPKCWKKNFHKVPDLYLSVYILFNGSKISQYIPNN